MRTPPITTGKSGDTLFFLTLNKNDLTHLPFPLPWGCPSSPHLPLVLAVLFCYPGKMPSCLIVKRQPYELSLPGKGSAWKSKPSLVVNLSLLLKIHPKRSRQNLRVARTRVISAQFFSVHAVPATLTHGKLLLKHQGNAGRQPWQHEL